MALTKDRIAERIFEEKFLSKPQAAKAVETLLEIIKKELENGEDVLISGFGKFCVKEKKKRRGRNPATGDEMILPARKVVTFSYSGILKDKLNGDGD
jgi:integration host factor subunit alpha